MSTTLEHESLPAVPAELAALMQVLRIPDVSAIDITQLSSENLASLHRDLTERLAAVDAVLEAVKAPVVEMRGQATGVLLGQMDANGGTMLPHPTLSVERMRTPAKRDAKNARWVEGLFELFNLVPADQLAPCMWIESLDVRGVTPEAIDAIRAAGARETWKCDLRKLDSLAKKFGENSEIAKIIKEATPAGDPGPWVLVIQPRESAMKVAS